MTEPNSTPERKSLHTLLIANRGEIALRVMRSARAMGLRTVAVYSDADAEAPHTRFADHAVHIGPSPAAQSYLRADAILEAARAAGADAIHPGYGLLSENAAFAAAVNEAGFAFVGPPASAIALMADKAAAKRQMRAAGVPCVPGYDGDDQSLTVLHKAAHDIGYPLMLKAVAGGGGRGMRLVHDDAAFEAAAGAAASEAEAAFGDGRLLLERAVISARHVEIQVFADAHGNVVHLGERDCSVQRRHQKIIEEAPCPVMTPELRARMGEAAVAAARAVHYRGAGTVEFLLDGTRQFYFLEMNTRLQVEHPVTELVAGVDLVEWQLRVAAGEALPLAQEDLAIDGHAIEVRLCAESPAQDFLPSTGRIELWAPPTDAHQARQGVRVDAGIDSGGEVSVHYDSMIAKIISHGRTREDARRKLRQALGETALLGPDCNRDFLLDVLRQPAFVAGEYDTGLLASCFGDSPWAPAALPDAALAGAAALLWACQRRDAMALSVAVNDELLGWCSTGELESMFDFGTADAPLPVLVCARAGEDLSVAVNGAAHSVRILALEACRAELRVDGQVSHLHYVRPHPHKLMLASEQRIHVIANVAGGDRAAADDSAGGVIRAPMHGRVLEVFVESGASVGRGDRLAVLEAMKMQHEILADAPGVVEQVAVAAGAQIAAGEILMVVSTDDV